MKSNGTRNWQKYNRNLVNRGAIVFHLSEKFIEELYFTGKQKRGGTRKYTPACYEFLLSIKLLFKLPWRATLGFALGLLEKTNPQSKLSLPHYSHASRAVSKLKLRVKPCNMPANGVIELAIDSTGVNVYTTSGWHQRNYSKSSLCRKREQWKKVHVAMDLLTGQVIDVETTCSNTNDCVVIDKLCRDIKYSVQAVYADGAYDTYAFHKLINEWGATPLIPPSVDAKAQTELKIKRPYKGYLEQRDSIIRFIKKFDCFSVGLKAWKIDSGYHKRSLVENLMFRFKRIFGFNLQLKTKSGRRNEIITKMNLLNCMLVA